MGSEPSNPFVVCEEFAKQFILSCRKMLVDCLVLKGVDTLRDLSWRYIGNGVVEYTHTETVHHPAGFHMVGSTGFADFAAFSDWEEDVRRTFRWNVCTNTRPGNEESVRDDVKAFASRITPFMDCVFADRPVSFAWVRNEVFPRWDLVKAYF